MDCRIEWKNMSLETWRMYFQLIRRSTLTQSYDYARAAYPLKGQKPRWGVIYIDEKKAGIVQIAEAGLLKGIFHAVILDLGPLWFNTSDLEKKTIAFFKEFARQFPKRWGRKRRVIPNYEETSLFSEAMCNHGYSYQIDSSYQTIWLDLTQNEEQLREDLHKKWRNQLKKAENSDLTFVSAPNETDFHDFLALYQIDYTEKNYRNIAPNRVHHFYKLFCEQNAAHLLLAKKENRYLAAAFILEHGSSATYQIGHVSPEGRQLCANNFLLWKSFLYLRSKGVKDFDLGGLNAYDAKSIGEFKEKTGGKKTTYQGIFS